MRNEARLRIAQRDFDDIQARFCTALSEISVPGLPLKTQLEAIRDSDGDIYAARDALLALRMTSRSSVFLDQLWAVPATLPPVEFHYACRDALRGSPVLTLFLFVTKGFL